MIGVIAAPLILSLALDTDLFATLDDLRRRHFPPERNHLSAHVTLFHHLPGDELDRIAADLTAACAATPAADVSLSKVRFLGKGVALDLTCPPVVELRNRLAKQWDRHLTPQDLQRYAPHVTVQNKADPADARGLYERLRATWSPLTGTATGLLLWHYRGGPWEPAGSFPFAGPVSSTRTA